MVVGVVGNACDVMAAKRSHQPLGIGDASDQQGRSCLVLRPMQALQWFKDQGFEVFSVSLDSDVNRWKAAIEQDQLAWPNHVSDLAGWRNAAAREYGISSIPHTMLIDRDGSILATHLRGGGVESALRGIFEK